MAERNTPEEEIPQAPDSLLSDLEELLDEEGAAPDSEEEQQEDLAALLEEENVEADSPPAVSSPLQRRTASPRSRAIRRRQEIEEFRNLDTQLRFDSTAVQVSEDRLTATLSRITIDDRYEDILRLLQTNGIVSGIDHETIRSALNRAATGQTVFEVVVARGRPPRIVEQARIVHHLPEEMLAPPPSGSQTTDFERLKQILEGPHLTAAESWKGVVKPVLRGDVISEIQPTQIEPGEDVYGEPVQMEDPEKLSLECGENTSLSEDGLRVVADIYGYAGLINGVPTVLPPIWISEDRMEARFVFYPSSEPVHPPSQEDLEHLLEMLWIEFGVMKKQLELIQKRLSQGRPLPVTLPIAKGRPELPGEHARIQYAFDAYSVPSWNQIQSLWNLPTARAVESSLKELYENPDALRFTAFRSGEIVAEKIPATEGTPGKDVQGEEIIPEEGQDVPLEVGSNLSLVDDSLHAVADCFGYICLQWDIQVALFSPLWISPDKTAAYFVNLPQTGTPKYPTLEEMQELLERAQIKHGFSAERWVENLAALESDDLTDHLILVAEGTPVQEGKDATFEWAIEISDQKPGTILEDGSIDFRERNLNMAIKEGDLIGRLVPPEPGVPGKDVFGNEIPPSSPLNIEVVTDSRINADPQEDGSIAFYAAVDGGIFRQTKEKKRRSGGAQRRIHVSIYPITTIENDVDYSTGNMDFNGDVVIGGSVRARFSVKAIGSVTIGGYVESGAFISAGRDILVKYGIVGASTELTAGGNVMAKYIQEATVRADGNVEVGAYIFNASIRAGGKVLAIGQGESKSRALVGGLIWGARGIVARSIGSPYNSGTRLVAGIDPEQVNRTDQIRANMQACREKQRAMMERIGVEGLDIELIRQRLARIRKLREKQKILRILKRIAKLAELEQNLQKELSEIAETQRKLALRSSIDVQNDLFAGVELRIGEYTLAIRDDTSKVSYHLVQDDEELTVQSGPFRGSFR